MNYQAAQVGTTVLGIHDQKGWIAAVEEENAKTYSLGGSGMVRNCYQYSIVWDNNTYSIVSDGIANDWIERASMYDFPIINDAPERLEEAKQEQIKAMRQREAEQQRAKAAYEAFLEDARAKVPSWAKAVIVAELEQDDCDSMSDYYNTKTTKTVILGFSKHTRDLFSEMRAAARNYPETANLADAPKEVEHREKYSMGAGYYLKDGHRYNSGWTVRKHTLNAETLAGLPMGEWSLGENRTANVPTRPAQAVGNVTIEQHTHTKKGFEMFIVILADRVERETYLDLLTKAKGLGGWYTRKWDATPAGFAFKIEANAEEFAAMIGGDNTPPSAPTSPNMAGKFQDMADKMQPAIDAKFADRLENTPKRQREAQSARNEGARLERTQKALLALADVHDKGEVPQLLASIRTKKQVYELCAGEITASAGYYDAGYDTGKPYHQDETTLALWALLGSIDPNRGKEIELAKVRAEVKRANIPGFFPTPSPIITQMIERLRVDGDSPKLLEPNAGDGAILKALASSYPNAEISAFEISHTLRDLLTLEGFKLDGWDFLEAGGLEGKFDGVVMNPPFENQQDIDHVLKAFECLKPGGHLVAIMSPSAFFRTNRKSEQFREWFDGNNGHKIDLDAGAFKESGTNVSTVLISVEKWNG
jgi:predicted RNA methylase